MLAYRAAIGLETAVMISSSGNASRNPVANVLKTFGWNEYQATAEALAELRYERRASLRRNGFGLRQLR